MSIDLSAIRKSSNEALGESHPEWCRVVLMRPQTILSLLDRLERAEAVVEAARKAREALADVQDSTLPYPVSVDEAQMALRASLEKVKPQAGVGGDAKP